jgi:hypothetical protein
LSKNKVQWLNLTPWLWLTLIWFPFTNIVGTHFEIITKFFKPCLNLSSPHYSWFMQYMKNNNGDCKRTQLLLGMIHVEVFQVFENCSCSFMSCPYAQPHTWWLDTSMPIMSFRVNVRL